VPIPHKNTVVHVSAPARLHLGFLDLNGSIGRKFGSIGLAIDSYATTIIIKKQPETTLFGLTISDNLSQRIIAIIKLFYQTLGQHIAQKDHGVAVNIEQLIPKHAGFGSGTQLTLTIGTALCRLHAISATTAEIAHSLGRGKRSGIGIATFDLGGFIIDGGNVSNTDSNLSPPLIAQPHFDNDWRIVLIMDNQHQGVHGQQEKQAFDTLPTFPQSSAQAICHLTLMQLLPALVEKDLDTFGSAISQIQSLIGDHFAPIQGGRYTSKKVAQALDYAQQLNFKGIAQSSWGPTGCVFVADELQATQLVSTLSSHYNDEHTLSFIIAKASQYGATIEINSE